MEDKYFGDVQQPEQITAPPDQSGVRCQIVRSCAKWSHGVSQTEHSIQNAYIEIIRNSECFIYIENQFFITATSDRQRPFKNKIGAAIADRCIRAARNGQRFMVIVIIPSVPGFAGDLKNGSSLDTRAIMKYQYDSINRGGHSIMETIAAAGFDPTQYIRFYNLRSYDRINSGKNAGYPQYAAGLSQTQAQSSLETGRWDSVSECYMLDGDDIRNAPWWNGDLNEMDAFVSEELYIHSKVLCLSHGQLGLGLIALIGSHCRR
jgi:phospholipase D1/2